MAVRQRYALALSLLVCLAAAYRNEQPAGRVGQIGNLKSCDLGSPECAGKAE